MTGFIYTDKETQIYIIGTVHKETGQFNSDTLLRILNEINPDVILVECDSSYFTSDFEFQEDIKNYFLETKAVSDYQKSKNVIIRPYDITGRDLHYDDYSKITREKSFFKKLDSLKDNYSGNNEVRKNLNSYHSLLELADKMTRSEISYINSIEGSKNIDTINYSTYEGLYFLVSNIPELSPFKSYWIDEYNFWNKRNDAMIENIFKYSKQFEGKRIVVLCGFGHKNILEKGILKNQEIELVRWFSQ